jgi:MFS family permease
VIATIIVGFISLVLFVLWESFRKLKEPLMPMNLFTNRGWNAATIVSGVGASMFYAFAVVWPRMVSELYTDPKHVMSAALLSSVQSIGITVGEILSGALARHIGHVKWQTIFAFTAGGALYAGQSHSTRFSLFPALIQVMD